MASVERPAGRLYTEVYLDRGAPQRDSEAFRHRLGAYLHQYHYGDAWKFRQYIFTETGRQIRLNGTYAYVEETFLNVPAAQVLNLVTLTHRFLVQEYSRWAGSPPQLVSAPAEKWLAFVARALREENVGYTIDPQGGMHPAVDQEFVLNRNATVAALQSARYAAVLDAFESAHRHLDSTTPDTKASVRALFESIEILVKLFIETKNLNRYIVEKQLKPMALAQCNDEVAQTALSGVFDGFGDWVDGIHWYRHGQPVNEPAAPSLSFAVFVLSSGASYLRLIAGLDPGGEPAG